MQIGRSETESPGGFAVGPRFAVPRPRFGSEVAVGDRSFGIRSPGSPGPGSVPGGFGGTVPDRFRA